MAEKTDNKEDRARLARVKALKDAVLFFMSGETRRYSELNNIEQAVHDLVNALNLRLDQVTRCLAACEDTEQASPAERVANRLLKTATSLAEGGAVDKEIADEFESTLDMFDLSADLKRKSQTAKDKAETSAIKHKRRQ